MTGKKKKTGRSLKKAVVGAAATAGLALTGWYFVVFGNGQKIKVPAYEAIRVIDGDTFETAEGQRIRLASTEAPELGRCGSDEAKKKLEELLMGKPLYVKVVYQDPYRRQISFVYSGKTFINEEMLRDGFAYYYRSSPGKIGEELKAATEKARQDKKGIFGEKCTQSTNPDKPKCNIKGNLGNSKNTKIYYLPDCGVYPNTQVQLYLGDQWFCSETQAKKAGFRKPEQCP